ncbi:MAG TPA: septal ring lytic transglycosylase RlpA family protein [Candidatus Methylomirabilis sp.]|nr:septal ring lytic transglycosylase RlpA family protein [Candidatus Methylomirabilis sp.]
MKHLAVARQLGGVITLVSFAILLNVALAVAQGAEEGTANFYSDKFQGKKLASGERFDKNNLTASHKTLAYGTKVTRAGGVECDGQYTSEC